MVNEDYTPLNKSPTPTAEIVTEDPRLSQFTPWNGTPQRQPTSLATPIYQQQGIKSKCVSSLLSHFEDVQNVSVELHTLRPLTLKETSCKVENFDKGGNIRKPINNCPLDSSRNSNAVIYQVMNPPQNDILRTDDAEISGYTEVSRDDGCRVLYDESGAGDCNPRVDRSSDSGSSQDSLDNDGQGILNSPRGRIGSSSSRKRAESGRSIASRHRNASGYGRNFTTRSIISLIILTIINLLNYMDRYTIAGVLQQVTNYYKIGNADAGLLQTSFICSYMVLSPLFGYLGDRGNRKILMAGGIFFWSVITLVSSFISEDHFWLFLVMRGLVGVGEASYSTIAPTIIADLFVGGTRTIALAIFYFAIPVGSGMGYIVGSKVAVLFGSWQWSLRVTPIIGAVSVVLIILVLRVPQRGESEGGSHISNTGWLTDISYIIKNKSCMLSTGGFTCVAFVTGALALWAPAFMKSAEEIQGVSSHNSALKFGLITVFAGLFGVLIGSSSSKYLTKTYPSADPLICAFGMIAASPFLFVVLYIADKHLQVSWFLVFAGELFICLNWAIVTDILLRVVIPTRRSTAEAMQILISHMFGDAISPYLVGVISQHVSGCKTETCSGVRNYYGLQAALYMLCFICVLGGAFFLATALYIAKDQDLAKKIVRGEIPEDKSSPEYSNVATQEDSLGTQEDSLGTPQESSNINE